MVEVVIVYHSGFGHTKLQAEAIHRGAAGVAGVEARLLTTDEAISRLDELDHATAIIFGCPTYMGSMSAEMKNFVEAAVKKWFTLAWKDKIAGAFTNSSSFSGDKLNTLMGLVINAMQHGMMCTTGPARSSGRCPRAFKSSPRMPRPRAISKPPRRMAAGSQRSPFSFSWAGRDAVSSTNHLRRSQLCPN